MSTQVVETPAPVEAVSLAGKDAKKLGPTTCIQFSLGGFGTKQKVDATELATDGDSDEDKAAKEALHVSKDILEGETLRAIRKLDADIRAFIINRSLPSRILKGGMYALPLVCVPEVEDALKTFKERREFLVERLIQEYEDTSEKGLIAQARQRLGAKFFNERDYPSAAKVKASYTIDMRYFEIEVPSSLKSISAALHARETQKAASAGQAMVIEARNELRAQMKEMIAEAVDRLRVDDDGTPQKFKNSSVEKFESFLTLTALRNTVVGDGELEALVDQARKVVRGARPEQLRKDMGMREFVRGKFDEIKKAVDALPLEEVPSRRIVFDEA